ncbi:protein YaeO [Pseudomonas sp. FH4]|jgi:Rho-binding antiterminator|uniref:Transcriptional antiterminator n=1 Tax=Pseudomonas brenneri TaxID=129817 RepID=A0A5B2UPD5_9PSED|nr:MULTISPECIES: Rho-binding antiterminator [Pseudomonas]KAA6175450.1 transcriptional antiterminator [Pseudomonas marginalis]MDZ4302851.1 Rho-binding antiterminator [Pseudomonas sp.]ETK19154.1 protein YaeO [Pseudomonas sp. FH4]KAA2228521.1 transcriptional antiterminator [Pseudomonas brenneri]MBF8006545.1 Rho-binding antiterminator [Pseudomonas brenneri]
MNAYQPLNCDVHDYLEIACLHGYRLQVELIDGRSYAARALTTRTATSKEEFLVLCSDSGQFEVRLDQLLAITPLDDNARFGRIELT